MLPDRYVASNIKVRNATFVLYRTFRCAIDASSAQEEVLMTIGDMRRKELALGRIKRLASSGLPLEPFARAVHELVNDGVPHSPNRVILAGGSDHVDAYIGSTPGIAAAVPLYHQYFVDAPPEVSGMRFSYDSYVLKWVLPSRIIWPQEELALPNLYRAEGYNTVYRPLGWHHLV